MVRDMSPARILDERFLQPELFRFTEGIAVNYTHESVLNVPPVHDNEELANRANLLLVRMCGVAPPQSMINPLLNTIFSAIQKAPVRH